MNCVIYKTLDPLQSSSNQMYSTILLDFHDN